MEGSYFHVIYNFDTTERGEISLRPGDIVKVIQKVDDNWLRGEIGDRQGNFPSSFVEPVTIPQCNDGQKVFAAVENFAAETGGDLPLERGDIILGLRQIDSNWWEGQVKNLTGIFPLTHVRLLDIRPTLRRKSTGAPPDGETGKDLIGKAKALMDLTAQIDDELSFQTGDIINITKILDEDFCMGECNGDVGMFPLAFVEVIEKYGSALDSLPVEEKSYVPRCGQNRTASFTSENTKSHDTSITAYAKTLYPFKAERKNELTFKENEIVELLQHVDEDWIEGVIDNNIGVFPASYVEIIVDCPWAAESYQSTVSKTDKAEVVVSSSQPATDINDNTSKGNFEPVTPVGSVPKYTPPTEHVPEYTAQTEKEPEITWSVKNAPVNDSSSGSVPSSVSLPSSGSVPSSTDNPEHHEDVYGLVKYDFKAESENDLDLREGDTVTVLRKVDGNWFEARHDNGHTGFCPINFIELIGPEPEWLSNSGIQSAPISNGFKVENDTKTNISGQSQEKVEAPLSKKPPIKTKPEILRPKPVLAPKPFLKSTVTSVRSVTPPQKVFESKDIAIDSSLDDIVKNQMKKAKDEVESRSRSSSSLSNTSNHSRDSAGSGEYTTNGLTSNIQSASVAQQSSDLENETLNQQRKASVKRGPPPRPTGPRLAAAPSRQPLEPLRIEGNVRTVPARPAPLRPSTSPVKLTAPPLQAPPRPQPPQTITPKSPPKRPQQPVVNSALDDLTDFIGFSPNTSITDVGDHDEDDKEALVADLQSRMAEIQKDIEQYTKTKKELQQKYRAAQTDLERPAIEEDIEDCNANIRGLTAEVNSLRENIQRLHPDWVDPALEAQRMEEEEQRRKEEERRLYEENKQKMKEKRCNVIQELLQTEKAYLKDLQLCVEAFLSPASEKMKDVDMETLFGNIEEVANLSQRMLSQLERAVNGKEFYEQVLGNCFVQIAEDMKHVYALYCRNHDDVLALLEKCESQQDIQDYFNRGLEKVRQHTTVFDLGSLLIKPVQRILKYPLLLNELLKSTEDSHPDKFPLLTAINAMTDVATAINEYKRRKDLVYKYRKEADSKLSDKISRLSIHSIMKKSNRLSMKLTSNLGLSSQTKDQQFNKEEIRFRNLEKAIKLFVRNVGQYIDQIQESVGCQETMAEDISDLYAENNSCQEVQQYRAAFRMLGDESIFTFKSHVERRVTIPLNKLLSMFHGPLNVIQKRDDKLLDYDSWAAKVKSTKDQDRLKMSKDQLQKAKNNYEALNAQLLDELPKLSNMSLQLFNECIGSFVQAHKVFIEGTLRHMYPLMELPIMNGTGGENVLGMFNQAHVEVVDQLADLSFVPKGFSSRKDSKPDVKLKRLPSDSKFYQELPAVSSQTESQRMSVRQQYPSDKLYTVTQTQSSRDAMSISLAEGDIVGVIKEQDPMGNKDKWFVDNGAIKGFVPSNSLAPFASSSPYPSPERPRASTPSFPTDLMELSPTQPSMKRQESEDFLSELDKFSDMYEQYEKEHEAQGYEGYTNPTLSAQVPQYYYAQYQFEARNSNEISLREGQPVTVLQKYDEQGNPDWWMVDIDGVQGYAPANYLYTSQPS
ncbi:dynamin-binding protein [Lingula anatina]|uniref:Dynamin-binding protein n=1 Tax=Lingula anatina TaxID=7574 RepID=A0A1S3HMN3_LINAN|nr:dynamin-binding protein [Lingula anatina]|eukprot:XP_013387330.1 dynamin-binding protein [Lingula anatina]